MNQTDVNICEKIDIKPFAYAVSLLAVNGRCISYFGFGKRSHALQRN